MNITLKLLNGETIENLEVNGNCLISEVDIPDEKLTDVLLSKITVNDVIYENITLVSKWIDDGKYWLALRQKTDMEIKEAEINSKLDKETGANIGRCYILAITNIVFARTDAFNDEIDKRIPFRNHILHNGIYQYSDSEISQMYFVLLSFIKNILIGGWAIKYEAFD